MSSYSAAPITERRSPIIGEREHSTPSQHLHNTLQHPQHNTSYWNQATPVHFDQPPELILPDASIDRSSPPQEDDQSNHSNNSTASMTWGDALETKRAKHVRIGFRNINSLPLEGSDPTNKGIIQDIYDGKLDVLGCSEINIAWQNVSINSSVSRRFKSEFEHSRFIASNNRTDSPILRSTQYGGTLLGSIGHMACRIIESGQDERNLGRWTWFAYVGKEGSKTRVVPLYRPVRSIGATTVYQQQQAAFNTLGIAGCPRQLFLDDLGTLLQTWYDNGDRIIVGGDFNEDLQSTRLSSFFLQFDMIDLIASIQQSTAPATHTKGVVPIDGIFGSSSLDVHQSGYSEFSFGVGSDHRLIWVDIPIHSLLGGEPPKLWQPKARKLRIRDPRIVDRYNLRKLDELYKHNTIARLNVIYAHLQQHGTLPPELITEINLLDRYRVQASLTAESKCRKFKNGNVPWSPTLQQAINRIRYCRLCLRKYKDRRKIKSHTLAKAFARQSGPIIRCVEDATAQLKLAYHDYYQDKPHAAVTRRKFLEDLAEAQAQTTGKDVKGIYNQLRHREEQRRMGAKVKALKLTSRKFVTEVTAPGADGSLQKFQTKEDIETQLCQESIRRFSQANNTPCMQPEQISLLGSLADSKISDSILQGNCPPDIPLHPGLQTLLPYLQTPATIRQAGDIDLSISIETYIKGWKKQREDTSSGGDMHFGHFKASVFNPTLAEFDRMFLEICLKTGHVLPRWKKATDIMIPKKKSSINVADMRTICLLPADWNFGNKLLSRRIMYHAETCNSIAPEQYGSRKGKSAIQHASNKALLFDLQRQQKHDAALIVLDAKACYDRIPLHIAALCLRRQGVSLSAIRFMFHPIATMRHTLRTGYGESTKSYNAQDHQFHGILQGNGAGPCIWVMVSSPLLDHLRSSGLGIERLDPTTGTVTSNPAITFVDDNDVVVSLQPYFSSPKTSIAIDRQIPPNLDRPQQALTTWTNDLASSAGATQGLKSSWQLLSHHFSTQNRWSLNKIKHSPGDLHLHQTEGTLNLQRKEFNDATLALGIMFSVDGSMKDQAQHLKSKVREWCDAIRTQKMSRYEVWYALNRCILRTLHYPLRATTLSQDEITSIMAPLLQTMLPRSGICRNIYRDALYCEHKHQGFGLPNLWDEQGLLKLMDLLGSDIPTDTTRLMHESLYYTQLEAGLGPNVLSRPFTPTLKALCTKGIITSLWEFCDQSRLQLVKNEPDRLHITGDFYLNERWLQLDLDIPTMRDLHVCRFFLQVETASDILYLSGTGIRYHVWNGIKFQHNDRWPIQPRPSEAAWTTWRTWLSKIFSVTDTGLFSIAQPIHTFGYQAWRWFMSKSQETVYEYRSPGNFRLYQRILNPLRRTRHDPEFLHDGSYVTDLPDQVYAITTVLIATDHILVDSKTNAPQFPEPDPSLPTWMSSIQHATVGSVDALRQAALAGELILVSDGSYKSNYATGAFILTSIAHRNSHYVEGSARTTGPGNIQDSYRAELFGILAGICHLNQLIDSWDLEPTDLIKLSLVVGCDNISALNVSFDSFMHPSITPYYSHYDVIQSIRSCCPPNLIINSQHVKGHQDNLGTTLDPLAELNVRMDRLCKQVRVTIESNNDNWTATLPFWKWMVKCDDKIVCTHVISTVKDSISASRMQQLSASLGITPSDAFSLVNWDAIGKAMDTCKPSHRRWVSKHNVGMCGVNKWKYIWGQHHTKQCIQCTEIETAQHTYLCQHQSVTTDWDSELLALEQWLDDANTEPTLHASIMAGIRSIRDISKVPLDNDISSRQNQIGWIQFFEGKLHIQWSHQQDLFYQECGSRRSGQRWCANLIKELWQFRRRMWKMRNHREHDNDLNLQRQALVDQIQVIINAGFHDIPQRNRNLHSPQELRRVLTSRNPEYHRSWIRNIQAAQAFTASRQAHQRDPTQQLIPAFFSTLCAEATPTQA